MLATRVATAAVGIPIIFGLIWIGGWPYAIVVAIALAVAAAEFAHLRFDWISAPTAASAVYTGGLTIALRDIADGDLGVYWAMFALIGVTALVHVVDSARYPTVGERVARGFWPSGAVMYLGLLGSTIVLLRDIDDGRDWVYLALFSTFAVDTAAYFVGRAIGRHKLAPSISPKKTWEGFFGGYAGGIAAVMLLNYLLGLRIDAAPALLIAATLPLAATLGDLLESWVKRRAGVKDASELIPGHGGVLDRLDSLLFVFPLVYVVARWVA